MGSSMDGWMENSSCETAVVFLNTSCLLSINSNSSCLIENTKAQPPLPSSRDSLNFRLKNYFMINIKQNVAQWLALLPLCCLTERRSKVVWSLHVFPLSLRAFSHSPQSSVSGSRLIGDSKCDSVWLFVSLCQACDVQAYPAFAQCQQGSNPLWHFVGLNNRKWMDG